MVITYRAFFGPSHPNAEAFSSSVAVPLMRGVVGIWKRPDAIGYDVDSHPCTYEHRITKGREEWQHHAAIREYKSH